MADTFDVLRTAANEPSIKTHLDMLTHMDDVYARLRAEFPTNGTFKSHHDLVLRSRDKLLEVQSKQTITEADVLKATVEIQADFVAAGFKIDKGSAGRKSLIDHGLIDG